MSTPDNCAKAAPSHRWLWVLLGITLGTTLLGAWIACQVAGIFFVSHDSRALRDEIMRSVAADWNKEVEVSIGSITMNLARAGLSFVDLPPEARTAMKSIRGAEVGVYTWRPGSQGVNHAVMLAKVDQTMVDRGWERLVGVMNRTDLVAVYVPRNIRSAADVKVCVAVMSKGQLVIAAARSNLEPLVELAAHQTSWCPKPRHPAQLSAVAE